MNFDDPDAEGPEALAGLPGVAAIRCTCRYWKDLKGHRPKVHQYRQTLNLPRVHAETGLDWLLHIDVDEFLAADRSLMPLLADAPGPMARIEPWDAL